MTLRLWLDPAGPYSDRACCSPSAEIAARETDIRLAATGHFRTPSRTSTVTARSRPKIVPDEVRARRLAIPPSISDRVPELGTHVRFGHHVLQVRSRCALVNRRTGNKLLNFTEDFRCLLLICKALNQSIDPTVKKTSSLADQAAAECGTAGNGRRVHRGRELLEDSRDLAHVLRARSAGAQVRRRRIEPHALRVAISGRGRKYKGLDPEINENGGLNFSTDEFLSQPPVRTYTVRMDLHW